MFEIFSNKEVGPDIYHLVLKCEGLSEKVEAGQFFNIKVSRNNSYDPLLRRPLSVFDFENETKRVEFVYKVVGKGTKMLANYSPGEEIDLLGPLGNPFTISDRNSSNIHLIGGGMGIAPLYLLAKKLKDLPIKVFLGAANAAELDFFADKFNNLGIETHLAAMEEKLEIQGTALRLWDIYLEKEIPNFVYCCGPEPLLFAVENQCLKSRIPGEISIEKRMGCGFGVCLSCSCESQKVNEKNKRACVEGPVFGLGEVKYCE
ncbi:dihydroorotate dehydrogenase electron transfer subunit [Halanaerobium hydrogeniformans]|uniref:Dihydroorotate dehydrogenase, electron transfer subunit, iron-sulfur cluster binding domain n=1 Tax=Halanaerobium hydrogeniformans TaxID=656519 RepID=E4RIV8_HALHG|nr:dihydroorotate dehydrogenase electron transfer subunit [Halanaerobium hydrogeniformans]ADQ15178.1 Dihydroorotate dehydrogenase, electron transfer subunit, iron-sulfur cluster binding domain [Halanaerobium hydrogeniformans]